MKKLLLIIAILVMVSGAAIAAGPECKAYEYDRNPEWSLSFSCGTSGIGIVDFVNNGAVIQTYMYFYFFDSNSGFDTVVICASTVINGETAPYHIFLYLINKTLVYPYFGMIFEEVP